MNIIIGILLIAAGIWLSYIKIKQFVKGISDTLGGNVSLLIIGIGLVVIGIVLLFQ